MRGRRDRRRVGAARDPTGRRVVLTWPPSTASLVGRPQRLHRSRRRQPFGARIPCRRADRHLPFSGRDHFRQMFPGTALGALLGNLDLHAHGARAQARGRVRDAARHRCADDDRHGDCSCSGPPSSRSSSNGMDEAAAAEATWHLGMAAMVVMGVLKTVLSFFGAGCCARVPRAGLLGSIAGIALVLMGFFPLIDILRVPVVGLACLGIVLYALVAQARMPFGIPGVLFSFLVGVVLYYATRAARICSAGVPRAGRCRTWRFNLPLAHARLHRRLHVHAALSRADPAVRPADGRRRHQRDRKRARGRRRLPRARHPADRGAGDARRGHLRRRRADHAVHRPARLPRDGRAHRLHVADGHCSSASAACSATCRTSSS